MFSKSIPILINSRNRESGTASNFTIKIPELVDTDLDRICCVSALIPKSYYLVQTGLNDTFTLTELGTNYTITLTPGNYTISNLKTILTTALTTASGHSWTYAVTYPTSGQVDTGKLTFSVSGNSGNQPSFTFSTTSPCEILGFNVGTISFTASTLTSTNVIKLQKEDALLLKSDVCEFSSLATVFASPDPMLSSIVYSTKDVYGQSKRIINKGNNVYHFGLTNEDGQPIDTNGQNIVLELLAYQDASQTVINSARMLQGYIKYQLMTKNNFLE